MRAPLRESRPPWLAAGAEIVAVTTDLTRQKFRDTNLLDRSHVVDEPRMLPMWCAALSARMASPWVAE